MGVVVEYRTPQDKYNPHVLARGPGRGEAPGNWQVPGRWWGVRSSGRDPIKSSVNSCTKIVCCHANSTPNTLRIWTKRWTTAQIWDWPEASKTANTETSVHGRLVEMCSLIQPGGLNAKASVQAKLHSIRRTVKSQLAWAKRIFRCHPRMQMLDYLWKI